MTPGDGAANNNEAEGENRKTMIDGLAKNIKTYIIFPWL